MCGPVRCNLEEKVASNNYVRATSNNRYSTSLKREVRRKELLVLEELCP